MTLSWKSLSVAALVYALPAAAQSAQFPTTPQGKLAAGFIAAVNMKRAGYVIDDRARPITICPSSTGCRSAASTCRRNSGPSGPTCSGSTPTGRSRCG